MYLSLLSHHTLSFHATPEAQLPITCSYPGLPYLRISAHLIYGTAGVASFPGFTRKGVKPGVSLHVPGASHGIHVDQVYAKPSKLVPQVIMMYHITCAQLQWSKVPLSEYIKST